MTLSHQIQAVEWAANHVALAAKLVRESERIHLEAALRVAAETLRKLQREERR